MLKKFTQEKDFNWNTQNGEGRTHLHVVCACDEYGAPNSSWRMAASWKLKINGVEKPLHLACLDRYTEIIQLLLNWNGS